ncbi:MAG: 1-(5-phosphoribosyl)-5-[(5-phosphoribosylamino)methylideneamino]imidazole-4-carboxamide isomerase [Acutalibacteraceae bacterium]|nr:1-(5-phosphoribosyl)-5-[(5-phosphoribosylamino)methylideneamino]imidazole-4-carboxamide isomerase [Acutalibacteraceae bacterium]
MNIFPAIDLFEGKAVRLYKGDYNQMTVYSENPEKVALYFKECGAEYIHLVDLEGAKSGETPNFETVKRIIEVSGLKAEIGGGVRSEAVIEKYINAGVYRVILGTAAATDPEFLERVAKKYGEKIAVGCDLKDGKVATKGWLDTTEETGEEFFARVEKLGIKTVICTDISRDGAMKGTNLELYKELSSKFSIDIIASGGVTDMKDVESLAEMNLYGAILGKAIYTGNIDLKTAIKAAK